MGYYSTKRRKTEAERRLGPVEIVCIVVSVLAVVALVVWIVSTAGGGVLMT
jgi:uncharacterized RDD family membrane protein YckC